MVADPPFRLDGRSRTPLRDLGGDDHLRVACSGLRKNAFPSPDMIFGELAVVARVNV